MSAVTGFPSPSQHSAPSDYGGYPSALPPGPYHHRHAVEPPRRRGIPLLGVIAIALVAAVALVGAGIAVAVAIRPPSAPADTRPAANGVAGNARLGGDLAYRAGKIDATYTLTAGPKLTLTPSGSRPSRGAFLGLTAAVEVAAGDVFLTDDNFVLVTAEGRRFEPDVSFLLDGGLRGARAAAGQSASGLVVWDVPPGSEIGATVELRIADGLRGTWQLP